MAYFVKVAEILERTEWFLHFQKICLFPNLNYYILYIALKKCQLYNFVRVLEFLTQNLVQACAN